MFEVYNYFTLKSPCLFEARHVCIALEKIEQNLLGPLGLATLDPE